MLRFEFLIRDNPLVPFCVKKGLCRIPIGGALFDFGFWEQVFVCVCDGWELVWELEEKCDVRRELFEFVSGLAALSKSQFRFVSCSRLCKFIKRSRVRIGELGCKAGSTTRR